MCGSSPGEPGGQPGIGRDRRLGAFQQVEVLAAARSVPGHPQVERQRQEPVRRLYQHGRVNQAQIGRRRQRRVAYVVGNHPVLQQGKGPVGLPGGEQVAGCTADLAGGLEPFGRAQLELLFPAVVAGPQLGAQQLADEVVIAEPGPFLVEGHQEQVRGVDGLQQRARVLPSGDRGACFGAQLAENRGVEHEPGQLGWLTVEHLGGEILANRLTADL
jgi:hypothetical protein